MNVKVCENKIIIIVIIIIVIIIIIIIILVVVVRLLNLYLRRALRLAMMVMSLRMRIL